METNELPEDVKRKIMDYAKSMSHSGMYNGASKEGAEFGCRLGLQSCEEQLKAKDEEIANLKTVMIAAAEEIQAHWQAHCDAEGYGPANLMHRLEKGIPAQYGYTSGAFMRQKELVDGQLVRIDSLTKEVEGLKSFKAQNERMRLWFEERTGLKGDVVWEALEEKNEGYYTFECFWA